MKVSVLALWVFSTLIACNKSGQQKTVELLGDSHIARFDNRYWLPNRLVNNYGIGGLTIDELLAMLKPTENDCIVEIGTNDILRQIAAGIPSPQVIARMDQQCKKLVEALGKQTGRVFIFEILPPAADYFPDKITGEIYRAANASLKKHAEAVGRCSVLPVTMHLDDGTYCLKKNLTNDGLHLNHTGYEVFSQVIYQNVR